MKKKPQLPPVKIEYEKLFETANDAIFIMNKQQVVVDCNSKALHIFGCTKKSDFIGLSPGKYFPKKQPDGQFSQVKAEKYQKQAFAGKPAKFYWQSIKKTGEPFDSEVSLNRLVSNNESYLLAIVRDISDRVEAEKKLKDSEEKFRTIVDHSKAIIFMFDQDLKLVLSAGQDLKKLGVKPNENIGRSARVLYASTPEYIKDMERALGGEFQRKIIFLRNHYLDSFVSPYQDEAGNKFVIGMAFDVTKQEEAKIKLKELDRIKTEFMNTAAHQLRTPTGSIRWSLEKIIGSEEMKKVPLLKQEIKKVYQTNLRVIDLANDLLGVARIEQAGKIKETRPVELRGLVEKILKDLQSEFRQNNLKIAFVSSKTSFRVRANKELLGEAIKNIVFNAVKYNKERDGKILIVLEKNRDKVKLSVANTGLIISKTDKERIFDKFFRSPEAIKREAKGTGLGLFLAKSYIEKFGGIIDFFSPRRFGEKSLRGIKYKGTVFTVTLPLVKKTSKV